MTNLALSGYDLYLYEQRQMYQDTEACENNMNCTIYWKVIYPYGE
jgi:hypothetical protein